jgi:hypothetical protein
MVYQLTPEDREYIKNTPVITRAANCISDLFKLYLEHSAPEVQRDVARQLGIEVPASLSKSESLDEYTARIQREIQRGRRQQAAVRNAEPTLQEQQSRERAINHMIDQFENAPENKPLHEYVADLKREMERR